MGYIQLTQNTPNVVQLNTSGPNAIERLQTVCMHHRKAKQNTAPSHRTGVLYSSGSKTKKKQKNVALWQTTI